MDLARYIRDIPDFPKPGILFKDITPLLASPQALHEAIHRLVIHYLPMKIDAMMMPSGRSMMLAIVV